VSVTNFRDLEVWRIAMTLAKSVYQLTAEFPQQERFGLSSQLQRAVVSIPSNIAEGNARHSRKEYLHFWSIASGSVAEVQTQILLASDLALTSDVATREARQLAERVSQMPYRMQQSLRKGLDGGSRVPGPGSRLDGPESRISEDVEEYL
jgi:four helix bundle protein